MRRHVFVIRLSNCRSRVERIDIKIFVGEYSRINRGPRYSNVSNDEKLRASHSLLGCLTHAMLITRGPSRTECVQLVRSRSSTLLVKHTCSPLSYLEQRSPRPLFAYERPSSKSAELTDLSFSRR